MLTIFPKINTTNYSWRYPQSSCCKKSDLSYANNLNSADSVHFKGLYPEAHNLVSIRKIVRCIKTTNTRKIAILTHETPPPDGDAVGSMIALKSMIKEAMSSPQSLVQS